MNFSQIRIARPRAMYGSWCVLLGVTGLLLATGCGKSKDGQQQGQSTSVQMPNDCNAVGVQLAKFTQVQSQGLEGRKARIVDAHLQIIKEDAIKTCKDENWSNDVRLCMVRASDMQAFNACTAPLRKAKGLPPPTGMPGSRTPAIPMPPGALEKAREPASGMDTDTSPNSGS